jgi:hypothetical protein
MLPIQRWRGQAQGRSRAVAYQGMVWAVATSDDEAGDVQAQARRCLELLMKASPQPARTRRGCSPRRYSSPT